MTKVTREADPLAIEPDRIRVELDGADPAAEISAVWESIRSFSSDARLARLEVFPELCGVAGRLRAELAACEGHATDDWRRRLADAEKIATRLHLAADAIRARALNARQKDPRGSRAPLLDKWLDAAVQRQPAATAKQLWKQLPADGSLCLDGDLVIEDRPDGRPRAGIAFAGFQARLTAAKKRRIDVSK
jgi:hypothetical protein